ncbi:MULTISPECIES: hypothetical protein [unclassified Bradyrhizobium]|uniref:hypothetical protein n=1 Tax=unclassified Bradyrhizobium TaxID=2631580 RepID=UPI002479F883|nr:MULTISPECIES: hypothetical protein [unclassified Bradyrhizobium]WGS21275.1 hypothetical protein MTX22_05920 [Bradyrhizobium sp. ISRA463]WGS28202.1 hypothetical protein MTX19_03765 [Bradyrhizobium sp. ISRA464]
MKPVCIVLVALAAFAAWSAQAAPPTVIPSPGYDARLQEQRARMAASSERPVPAARHIAPRHHKRSRTH